MYFSSVAYTFRFYSIAEFCLKLGLDGRIYSIKSKNVSDDLKDSDSGYTPPFINIKVMEL